MWTILRSCFALGLTLFLNAPAHAITRRTFLKNAAAALAQAGLPGAPRIPTAPAMGSAVKSAGAQDRYFHLLHLFPSNFEKLSGSDEVHRAVKKRLRLWLAEGDLEPFADLRPETLASLDAQENVTAAERLRNQVKVYLRLARIEQKLAEEFSVDPEGVRAGVDILINPSRLFDEAFVPAVPLTQLPATDAFVERLIWHLDQISPDLALAAFSRITQHPAMRLNRKLGIRHQGEELLQNFRSYPALRTINGLQFEFVTQFLYPSSKVWEQRDPKLAWPTFESHYSDAVLKLDQLCKRVELLPASRVRAQNLGILTKLRAEIWTEVLQFEERYKNSRSVLLDRKRARAERLADSLAGENVMPHVELRAPEVYEKKQLDSAIAEKSDAESAAKACREHLENKETKTIAEQTSPLLLRDGTNMLNAAEDLVPRDLDQVPSSAKLKD